RSRTGEGSGSLVNVNSRPMALRKSFDPDAASAPGSGIYGLPFTVRESRVVILPVPFEATTSYGGGASRAPAAVLRASRQVELYDRETGRPYEQGIAMRPVPARLLHLNREAKKLASALIRRRVVAEGK